ncbi:hypothetical protein V3C99_006994, partial [Haemonchus contortus]
HILIYILTRCMIDIGTLRKPLRQWESNEVIEFLKGIITDYEKEIFLHNNLTGSRLMDFCCMDFLVHILRISESSAVKVMSVLRPYLDEVEDTQNITRREYRFVLRRRHKKSKTQNRKSRRRLAGDQSRENMPDKEIRERKDTTKQTKSHDRKSEIERHLSGDDSPLNSELKTMIEDESPRLRSCSTQNDRTLMEFLSSENT